MHTLHFWLGFFDTASGGGLILAAFSKEKGYGLILSGVSIIGALILARH